MHYRSYRANFTATPTDNPAVYTYALDRRSGTRYYMSWNGCTQCAAWRIYVSVSSEPSGPYRALATVAKDGFETVYAARGFYQWSTVEAMDREGRALRNTTRGVETFVPGEVLRKSCDEGGGGVARGYEAPEERREGRVR